MSQTATSIAIVAVCFAAAVAVLWIGQRESKR